MKNFSITFLGGAGTVTGSKHLLTIGEHRILIDCGLFQGVKEHRLLNWAPLPVDVNTIHAVVLTHAHLDHTGYLPLLVKQGFNGPIYCSAATLEITKLILYDSAKIQMEDAEHANEHGYSKHKPALPLYTIREVEKTTPLLKEVITDQWEKILPGIEIRLSHSGHILGSTFVEVRANGKVIAFSGDLGREKPITLKPRHAIAQADYLVVESTYGDRTHSQEDPAILLESIINKTFNLGGQVLIPAFTIGRTQDLLYLLAKLQKKNRIPKLPIYLDSPMAEKATSIFDRYPNLQHLDGLNIKELGNTYCKVEGAKESVELVNSTAPAIIIAGSGMLNGGRIKRHVAAKIQNRATSIVLAGFQAAGTPGRFLKEGATEIKLFGSYLNVAAQIYEISSLSAHADQHEILSWIEAFRTKPKAVFIVHGEANAAEGLRVRITDKFHIPVHIAKLNETVEIS